ncbi:hypothetical protein [Alicyclobacillus mengziensis]|uniref:Uncharacterized protein n=1 Tax=Alicyclobacillus mengziensis TaxID=2931921 RepID=A0A9X7Z810_9BACL|nr:hypothetical protein [Alicyclobacillus mengziensis]QSO47778.1 hypothetical protein JZ786_01645 [Alicyclobacillus mengziensis]
MQSSDWLQEDIDNLHAMVLKALSEGKSREEGFKQYARAKGIKSVNAVRYKWITTSPSTAELTLKVGSEHDKKIQRPPGSTRFVGDELTLAKDASHEHDPERLQAELDRILVMVNKLRDKNRLLRRENRQLLENLQVALSRLKPEKPQVVIVVGAEDWKPEKLAKFIQSTQNGTEDTRSWETANPVRLQDLQA